MVGEKYYEERKEAFRAIYTHLLSQGMKENLNKQEIVDYIGKKYKPVFAQKILDLWFGVDPSNKVNIYYKQNVAYSVDCEEIADALEEDHSILRDKNDPVFKYKEQLNMAKVSLTFNKYMHKLINLTIALFNGVFNAIKLFVTSILQIIASFFIVVYDSISFMATSINNFLKIIFKSLGWVASLTIIIVASIGILFYNMDGKFSVIGYFFMVAVVVVIVLSIIFLDDFFGDWFSNYIGSGILGISALLYLNYYVFTTEKDQEPEFYTVPVQKSNRKIRSSSAALPPSKKYVEIESSRKKVIQSKPLKKELRDDVQEKVTEKYYVINTKIINVRNRPSSNGDIVTKLHKNKKVKITKKSSDWLYIDDLGWVYGKLLKVYTKPKNSKKIKIKKKVDRSVWHCVARSTRASGWVERVGKKNAMRGALRQCEIRRQTSSPCRIVNCYRR